MKEAMKENFDALVASMDLNNLQLALTLNTGIGFTDDFVQYCQDLVKTFKKQASMRTLLRRLGFKLRHKPYFDQTELLNELKRFAKDKLQGADKMFFKCYNDLRAGNRVRSKMLLHLHNNVSDYQVKLMVNKLKSLFGYEVVDNGRKRFVSYKNYMNHKNENYQRVITLVAYFDYK